MNFDLSGPNAYLRMYLSAQAALLRAWWALALIGAQERDGMAAAALFRLNRAAKRDDIQRGPVYDCKNQVVRIFYEKGYCVRAVKSVQTLECWHTRDYNMGWDDVCTKCDNTGVYARHMLYHFTFMVGGTVYNWHQPDHLVTWPVKVEGEPVVYEGRPPEGTLEGCDAHQDQALVYAYLRSCGVKDLPNLRTLRKVLHYYWWHILPVQYSQRARAAEDEMAASALPQAVRGCGDPGPR